MDDRRLMPSIVLIKKRIYALLTFGLLSCLVRRRRFAEPSVAAEGFSDYPLNLTVDRPEFLRCPTLHQLHRSRIETQ